MSDIKTTICEKVSEYVASKGASLSPEEAVLLLETPADSKLGDLALPCFKLSKTLRCRPDGIASELALSFESVEGLERVEAVGGYLNFFFGSDKYKNDLSELLKDDYSKLAETGAGKTIVLDFSSPNIAKRFHLGHLGTTVIGNAVRNIYKFCGYNTVALNYLGDWGTQNGKQIVAYKKWSSREKLESEGIKELERIYVLFGKEAEKDPSLNDQARAAFRELENGNEEYLEIWQLFKDISLREYTKTYERLGIDFDVWDGESLYTDKMPAIVDELREKELLKIDDGASIVDLSEYNMPPALILKRDGSTLYPTRDIAAANYRYNTYKFDKCAYVTSAGQSLHFAQWFKVTEMMGKEWAKDLVHIPYGTMSFGGEKLASRTGNIILLNDVFDEAVAKARAIIEEKNVAHENKEWISEAVGIGAVVFSALSSSRIKDTNFTWEGTLSFEGNTGPYVQYTYARAASVLRRGNSAGGYDGYTPEATETELIRKLCEFEETVKRAANDYEPSHISRFALNVCTLFNQFYHNCRILGSGGETEQFRLALTSAVRNILGRCLDILGMKRTEEI
ncbi:MAG: arginine--tRNA ligase [Ruminococcaceae bacterium]|nr:arginine--tRNA ligase [Oscillospiraceae bacterium]